MNNYWGSVRFFKHLILLGLAVMIAVPVGTSVGLGVSNYRLREELAASRATTATIPPDDANAPADPQVIDPTEPIAVHDQLDTPIADVQEDLPYRSLYPELYCEGPAAERETTENTVYLTFDDGPSELTPQILDILREKDVKACFFVVGHTLHTEEGRENLRRIAAEGHTIGIHSSSHNYRKIYASIDAFLEDFNSIYQKVYEITGVRAEIFRFPGGSLNAYNSTIYQELIAEMTRRGFTYYDWNVSSGDATLTNSPSAQRLADTVLSQAGKCQRAIVLMHDSKDKKNTVKALPDIIDRLRDEGYAIVPLTREVNPIIFGYR